MLSSKIIILQLDNSTKNKKSQEQIKTIITKVLLIGGKEESVKNLWITFKKGWSAKLVGRKKVSISIVSRILKKKKSCWSAVGRQVGRQVKVLVLLYYIYFAYQ